jgi:hypothetical protein
VKKTVSKFLPFKCNLRHYIGEAYARLRVAADKANDAAAGGGGGEDGSSIAPGIKLLAEGCAALADAYEAHLSVHVAGGCTRCEFS